MSEYLIRYNTTDRWISPNHRAFMALFAYFRKKGKSVTLLLNFVEVPDSHMVAHLAQEVEKSLKKFGVSDKVCYIEPI